MGLGLRGTIRGVCHFLGPVSSQQKFEVTDQLLDGPVLQLHVTAQFYLGKKGKYILEAWGRDDPKDMKRRERDRERERDRASERERETLVLWLLFLYVFLLPLGLPYVNWASQECCLFYLRSSLWSSDLPLFYFCGFFSSLSFSHHHSPFSYSNYLTVLT